MRFDKLRKLVGELGKAIDEASKAEESPLSPQFSRREINKMGVAAAATPLMPTQMIAAELAPLDESDPIAVLKNFIAVKAQLKEESRTFLSANKLHGWVDYIFMQAGNLDENHLFSIFTDGQKNYYDMITDNLRTSNAGQCQFFEKFSGRWTEVKDRLFEAANKLDRFWHQPETWEEVLKNNPELATPDIKELIHDLCHAWGSDWERVVYNMHSDIHFGTQRESAEAFAQTPLGKRLKEKAQPILDEIKSANIKVNEELAQKQEKEKQPKKKKKKPVDDLEQLRWYGRRGGPGKPDFDPM